MKSLDEIIENSKDVREVKRALAVKMVLGDLTPQQVKETLKVSGQFISKWKVIFEKDGAEKLKLSYQGSQGYLTDDERSGVVEWIKSKDSLGLEELVNHLKEVYSVTYRSKQSLYDLLSEGEMSWHKSEKVNPRRDEKLVLERREELKKNFWTSRRK